MSITVNSRLTAGPLTVRTWFHTGAIDEAPAVAPGDGQ